MTKSPFIGNFERGTYMLDIIRSDVCGQFRHITRYGEKYFVTFTNDFGRNVTAQIFKQFFFIFLGFPKT